MATVREVMIDLADGEPGFHTFVDTSGGMFVYMLAGAGFIKAESVDHLEDTFQIRITGAGKDFVERMRSLEKAIDDGVPVKLSDVEATMEEHFEIREMDPNGE